MTGQERESDAATDISAAEKFLAGEDAERPDGPATRECRDDHGDSRTRIPHTHVVKDTERPDERMRCGPGGDCRECGAHAGEPCRQSLRAALDVREPSEDTERPDDRVEKLREMVVELWHKTPPRSTPELHDCLGMTWGEYQAWVVRDTEKEPS